MTRTNLDEIDGLEASPMHSFHDIDSFGATITTMGGVRIDYSEYVANPERPGRSPIDSDRIMVFVKDDVAIDVLEFESFATVDLGEELTVFVTVDQLYELQTAIEIALAK